MSVHHFGADGIEGQSARVRTDGGRLLNARPTGDHQVEVTL